MGNKGRLPDYIPTFSEAIVGTLVGLAKDLIPVPYIYWWIYLRDEDWEAWQERRCDWLPGRPPLQAVIKKAWAEGVRSKLKDIEAQKAGWQAMAWRLERFDNDRFGRFERWASTSHQTVQVKEDKKVRVAQRSIKAVDPGALKRVRDALSAA